MLSAPGASLGQGRFWLDWPIPARYQHLPMAMLSGLIGVEGVRRLNCSCPSKESESYWSRIGAEAWGGGLLARVRPAGIDRDLAVGWHGGAGNPGTLPKRQRGAKLGRCWQRTSVGAAWRCPSMLALQGCGHANHRTAAPGLTHVAIGDFCRAHAVRDALGAAGGTVPCKDGQMGWVARPPADRRGREGWRAALTEGAVTVAVIGSTAQEGVRDAAGMPCKMEGSLSATGSLPWHPWPGAAQPFGTEQRLRRHGSELTGEDRAEASTYPVEMLGVPRKTWKGRDRVGETPKPRCSPASPRAVKPEPQDVPVPPTSGFVPMGTVP